MKIARVVNRYNKQEGISRGVAEVVERLVKKHEVHVFTQSWQDVTDDRIVFHRVPMVSNRQFVQSVSFFLLAAKTLQRYNFDIVHLHNSCACACDVVTCHGLSRTGLTTLRAMRYMCGHKFPLRKILYLNFIQPILEFNYSRKRSRRIIALSQAMKSELLQLKNVLPANIVVIPNGVNLDEFHPGNRTIYRAQIREELKIESRELVFLFVGNYYRRKGLQFIFEGLSRIGSRKVKLIVAGHDLAEHHSFVERTKAIGINEQVLFIGHVSDMRKWYAASDAFLLPTMYEGFSLAIIEAMASGLPVITTKVAGAIDLVTDRVDGLLINLPVDLDELIEKMELLIEDKKLRDDIGKKARKTAEAYSWDIIAERTLELYSEVLGSYRG